jgi:hypothetical protein
MSNRSQEIDEVFEKYYNLKEQKALLDEQLNEYKEIIEDLLNEFDTDILKSHKYTAKMNKTTCTRILKKDLPQDIIDEYSTQTTTKTLQVYKTSEGKPTRRSRSRSRGYRRLPSYKEENKISVKKYIKNKYL